MKDYHYECMIIVLTHLAAEVGDLINIIQDRGEFVEERFNTVVSEKFNEFAKTIKGKWIYC